MLFGFIFFMRLGITVPDSNQPPFPMTKFFFVLLLLAPAIFALKITFARSSRVTLRLHPHLPWNQYWNKVLDWPLKLLAVVPAGHRPVAIRSI